METSFAKFQLPKGNPDSVFSFLKTYKQQLLLHSLGGIIYNTIIVAGPILLGKTLDAAAQLEKLGPSQARIKALALYCLSFVMVTTVFQYGRYLKRWYMLYMSNRIACDMRAGLISSVLRRPMKDLEQESVGDLMSRTVGDVEQVVATLKTTITEVWDTWLLMISYFIALLFYSPSITLLCAIPIPVAIFLAEAMRHPLYNFSLNNRKAASQVNSHLHRTLNGIHILRLFGREDLEQTRFQSFCRQQMNWNIKTNLLQIGMMPVYAMTASLGIIGVIGMCGTKVASGSWTIGQFTSYLAMFTAMSVRTQTAAKVFNQLHAAKASWDRIREKMRKGAPTLPNESENSISPLSPLLNAGSIQVRDLSFQYPNCQPKVLADISFSIPPGAFVGITGAVGSGKTALATVLTGLYPYQGSLTIAGQELSQINPSKRSQLLAYSGQDSFLFSTSIAENITFQFQAEIDLHDQKLQQAVYISALTEDLAVFSAGLATIVGEKGIRVSGGQRQRIALARAIYTQNPILILDDPFSAVDIGTEQKMIERLRNELPGTTILVFSHRLAAFTQADWIMVMQRGRLIEQGTHHDLVHQKGIYERIYTAQNWMESEAIV